MMHSSENELRVLAIDPTTNGFGFAVMESPSRLVDWGVKEAAGDKNLICVQLVANLMARYQPDIVVVETPIGPKSRRCERVKELVRNILDLAVDRKIRTRAYSRAQVRAVFANDGSRTKHEIATAIAKRLPELSPRIPRFRQPWMSEDSRMAFFAAVALALTFYHSSTKRHSYSLSALGIDHHVEHQEDKDSGD